MKPGFEESLQRLEGLVQKLERGELPLEEALAAFDEGMKLSQQCQKWLDAAEKRVEQLTGGAASSGSEVG